MYFILNEDVPAKKAKITAEGDFSQPSSKHHSLAEVFLVSLIINFMRGERQDFEINKSAKRVKNNFTAKWTINLPLYS